MALTARDLFFSVRVADRASRPVRRIASEIRALGTAGDEMARRQLAARQAALQVAQAQSRLQFATIKAREAQQKGIAYQNYWAGQQRNAADAIDIANQRLARQNQLLHQVPIERMRAFGNLVSSIGREIRTAGVIGTAATGFAAAQSAAFATAGVRAATQARRPGAPIAQTAQIAQRVNQVVLNQMKEFPASAREMQDALYEIFSGTNVQNIGEAGKLLRLFNQAAVGGQAPLEALTDAGISLYNNFKSFRENPAKGLNLFFSAVRYGRMNVEQFANALPNVVSIAQEAGLTFRDVADAMAILTRQTGARLTSRDAQGLAQLIQLFGRKEVMAGLDKMGVQVEDASGKMRPLLSIIKDIRKNIDLAPGPATLNFFKTVSALGGAGTGSRGLQGTINARRSFAYLYENAVEYERIAAKVNADTDEFAKSWMALQQSPGVRWRVFLNQIKALIIVMGQGAIPAFVKLGSGVVRLVHWFEQLSPHTRRFIGYLAVFLSVGALVGGSLLAIVGGLISLIAVARLAGLGFSGLSAEGGFVNARFAILMGSAAALIYLFIKYPGVVRDVTHTFGGLKGVLEILGVVVAALTLRSLISSLITVGGEATVAGAKVNGLRGALLGLNGMRVVATIALSFAADKAILNWVKGSEGSTGLDPLERLSNVLAGHTTIPSGVPVIGGLSFFRKYKPDITKLDAAHRGALNAPPTLGQQPVNQAVYSAFYQGWVNRNTGLPLTPQQQNEAWTAWRRAHVKGVQPHNRSVADLTQTGKTAMQTIRDLGRQGAPALKSDTAAAAENVKKLAANYTRLAKAAAADPTNARKQLRAIQAYQALIDARGKQEAAAERKATAAAIAEQKKRERAAETAAKKAAREAEQQAKKQDNLQKQAADNIVNYQTQAIQTLTQQWNQFQQANQESLGQLFQGPQFTGRFGFWGQLLDIPGLKLPFQVLQQDLKGQVDRFSQFRGDLTALARRGVPRGLITQLQGSGVSALPQIESLRRASRGQLRAYIAEWRRGQAAVQVATAQDFQPVLDMWKSRGKQTMEAYAQGIESGDFTVANAIKKVLLGDIRGARPATGHGRHGQVNIVNHGDTITFTIPASGDPKVDALARKMIWQLQHHKAGK